MGTSAKGIPVLLLKTKSSPTDGYEDYFNSADDAHYQPLFLPVLEHRLREDGLAKVRSYIAKGKLGLPNGSVESTPQYGGIIFTSQRAVEAFGQVINSIHEESGSSEISVLKDLSLYVVGPATARALRALQLDCRITGEDTGNGDALAAFILEDYNSILRLRGNVVLDLVRPKPVLLFLVGEQRRDIIPKTLQSDKLEPRKRITVEELEVYGTAEMQSFKSDFTSTWSENVKRGCQTQWVVVFSPTGCKAMLDSLGMLDSHTGKVKESTNWNQKRPFIATIGPTTRNYLKKEFGFEADVCAREPSPKGVYNGISEFMAKQN